MKEALIVHFKSPKIVQKEEKVVYVHVDIKIAIFTFERKSMSRSRNFIVQSKSVNGNF